MEQLLAIRTLLLLCVVITMANAMGIYVYSKSMRRFNGLKWLSSAYLFFSLGFTLIFLRAQVGEATSVLVGNILVFTGFVLVFEALKRFKGASTRLSFVGPLLLLILVVLFGLNVFLVPDVNQRIIIIGCLIAIQLGITIKILFKSIPIPQRIPCGLIIITSAVYAVQIVLRVVLTMYEIPIDSYFDAGLMHGISMVIFQMWILAVSFSIVWICSLTLEEELKRQATIDPLTGAYNRRALGQIANQELARAMRYDIPLSIIMADLDHFKRINDKFGHLEGDGVLSSFTKLLHNVIRSNDIVARYGGEEFLIMLPETAIDQSIQVAEKLRAEIENTPLGIDGKHSITASFGVATFKIGDMSWEDFVDASDQALYEAKRSGRNCVR